MHGWRARIGLLIPSSNTTMEEEFRRLLPDGVSLHAARMRLREVTVDELYEMERDAVSAAQRLADADVDIIAYGCTSGSLVGGVGYDAELSKKIREAVGKLVIATASAVVEALKKLRVKRVAVATPYIDEVNEKERRFLEDNGFRVVRIKGLGIAPNLEIGRQPPHIAYRLAREVDGPDVDGVFISCTNFRTLEILGHLEADLGKPVVSSNQATFWAILRALRIGVRISGYGALLESP